MDASGWLLVDIDTDSVSGANVTLSYNPSCLLRLSYLPIYMRHENGLPCQNCNNNSELRLLRVFLIIGRIFIQIYFIPFKKGYFSYSTLRTFQSVPKPHPLIPLNMSSCK